MKIIPSAKNQHLTLAATGLNALILAGETGETLTLTPELALDLAPELVRQALQTLQLSGKWLTPARAEGLAGRLNELAAQLTAYSQQNSADITRFQVLFPTTGVPNGRPQPN